MTKHLKIKNNMVKQPKLIVEIKYEIANSILVLDKKTNLCQEQIANIEALKKGLLQQMFV